MLLSGSDRDDLPHNSAASYSPESTVSMPMSSESGALVEPGQSPGRAGDEFGLGLGEFARSAGTRDYDRAAPALRLLSSLSGAVEPRQSLPLLSGREHTGDGYGRYYQHQEGASVAGPSSTPALPALDRDLTRRPRALRNEEGPYLFASPTAVAPSGLGTGLPHTFRSLPTDGALSAETAHPHPQKPQTLQAPRAPRARRYTRVKPNEHLVQLPRDPSSPGVFPAASSLHKWSARTQPRKDRAQDPPNLDEIANMQRRDPSPPDARGPWRLYWPVPVADRADASTQTNPVQEEDILFSGPQRVFQAQGNPNSHLWVTYHEDDPNAQSTALLQAHCARMSTTGVTHRICEESGVPAQQGSPDDDMSSAMVTQRNIIEVSRAPGLAVGNPLLTRGV